MSRIDDYLFMIKELKAKLSRKSALTPNPSLSKGYMPGRVGVYFFDFSHKTSWPGMYDSEGFPINVKADAFYKILIIQKALCHHNNFLKTQNQTDRKFFIKYARWIAKKIRPNGLLPAKSRDTKLLASSIIQGMACSVMIRAFQMTKDQAYLVTAEALINYMAKSNILRSRHFEAEILEEFPNSDYFGVLNGWIFAVFGIYELSIITKKKLYKTLCLKNIQDLDKIIGRYDSGFWSYYDLNKHMASKYYHLSHILMLETLSLDFPHFKNFKIYAKRFSYYARKKRFIFYSQLVKIFQKLVDPSEAVY